MELALARNWWSLMLRGLLGVVLGVIAFAWPGITLAGIVIVFGAYALIGGVLSIAGAVKAAQAHERWGVLVIEGVLGIAAAAVTVLWPAITAIALVYIIGAWAIVIGAMEIAAAVRLREFISGEWLLLLSGIASLVFGILIMMNPLIGAVVMALWFGIYAFVFGVILIALAMRLRGMRHQHFTGPAIHAPVH
jgi:uncharacterized membrane protein HdeD (DUF308 family)